MDLKDMDAAVDVAAMIAYDVEECIEHACAKRFNAKMIGRKSKQLQICVEDFLRDTSEFVCGANARFLVKAVARIRWHVSKIANLVADIWQDYADEKDVDSIMLNFYELNTGLMGKLQDREREVCSCLFNSLPL